jgi:hypothetical protein
MNMCPRRWPKGPSDTVIMNVANQCSGAVHKYQLRLESNINLCRRAIARRARVRRGWSISIELLMGRHWKDAYNANVNRRDHENLVTRTSEIETQTGTGRMAGSFINMLGKPDQTGGRLGQ